MRSGRTGGIYVLERFGPVKGWATKHLPRVHEWFERYGKWTLFFGYFIAGVRHFTALTAGISKLELRPFALYAYSGALVWVICFVSIGYFLGAEWTRISERFDRSVVITVAAIALVGLTAWWLRRKAKQW